MLRITAKVYWDFYTSWIVFRTESVAEKLLTNWLTLCMYDHLRDHSGKALFMLYKAIKHQTEKGPVDVITSDARYALTEYRLLQQKIETRVLVNTQHCCLLIFI